ncbi:MAG: helix-turn-helix domain-containing protein [Fibrobacterota bacterium]
MTRKRYFLVNAAAILIICAVVFMRRSQGPSPLILFPNFENNVSLSGFCDSLEWAGTSSCTYSINDSTLSLFYTLREGVQYPYAGLSLEKDDGHIDLSKYDSLVMQIDSTNCNSVVLCQNVYVDSFTVRDSHDTYLKRCKIIRFDTAREYTAALNEFIVPSWWLNENNLYPDDIAPMINHRKTASIELVSHEQNAVDTSYELHISQIKFTARPRGNKLLAILLMLLAGANIPVLVLYLRRSNASATKQQELQHKKLQVTNHADQEYDRLISYIGQHYDDPNLSVETVSARTGISRMKIPAILRDKHAMLFKQYLNSIRITEAQRLLCETDHQITEIALAVGYKYPSTFNRIFREITSSSPMAYRKKMHRKGDGK